MRLAARMRDHDIVPEFSFVLGNPVDPDGDVDATLRLVRRLKADNEACEIILYMYTPVPLPGMYDQAVAQGFSFPERLDDWLAPPWTLYEARRNAVTPWQERALVRRVYDFEAVLQLEPRHVGALTGRANVYRLRGDHAQALRDVALALEAAPDQALPYLARAAILEDQRRLPEALADWQRGLERARTLAEKQLAERKIKALTR